MFDGIFQIHMVYSLVGFMFKVGKTFTYPKRLSYVSVIEKLPCLDTQSTEYMFEINRLMKINRK